MELHSKARLEMAMDKETQLTFNSAVPGFHVYRKVWTPHFGQRLGSEREHDNVEDRNAVAVIQRRPTGDEDANTVGHLPQELSKVLWYLLHKRKVDREVKRWRQCSLLIQGGLEIPYCVTLHEKKKLVSKAQEVLGKKPNCTVPRENYREKRLSTTF